MAALQGNFRAQTEVGYFYRHGIGVKRDDFMAVEWYTRAAEAGHSVAQYNLGLRFLDGKGLREPNREKAVYWLKRAALQKDKDACKKLLKMGIVISRAARIMAILTATSIIHGGMFTVTYKSRISAYR